MIRTFFLLGGILGALAVAAGAFGAHALRDRLAPERLVQWELAARYQMYHALALLAVAWASERFGSSVNLAGWLFLFGTLVFCGTVYALALGSPRWFGAITPFGGLSLILGWLVLAIAAFRSAGGS